MADMPPPATDLGSIYDAHAPALFAFLLNITRREADARDILQEVFVKLARQPGLLEAAREPRAFLVRLAHNLAIDHLRRHQARERRHEAAATGDPCLFAPTQDPDEDEFRRALSEALGELPLAQRSVIHLKLWEGLTFEQIAETLEIPLNTAGSRYRYGIDKLRDRLRPLYEEIQ